MRDVSKTAWLSSLIPHTSSSPSTPSLTVGLLPLLLNGDDFDVGVNLLPDHVLDCHQRAGERAGATAARALVVYRQRVFVEREHFEPAAVGRKIRAYALVEHLVDARKSRVVAQQCAERSADSARGCGVRA